MPISVDVFVTGGTYTAQEAQDVAQAINGSGILAPVRVATTTQTLTISAGSVSQITGTVVDGVTVSAGDRILIPNAPVSTGAAGGTTLSSQPSNGVYYATGVSPNISVSRVYEMGGGDVAYNPAGWTVAVTAGTWGGQEFSVIAPVDPRAAMSYGSTNVQFQVQPNLTNAVTLSGKTLSAPTVTGYTESVVANGTVTTACTLDLTSGTVQTATLTASTGCTFTMPATTAGKSFVLLLKQAAATGNGTATFTGVKWNVGTPVVTATAGKMDIFSFVADASNWYGSVSQGYTP